MTAPHDLPHNPFYVLEVPTDATPEEIDRARDAIVLRIGQRVPGADFYATPLGSMPRDAEAVREAAASLRDPRRRLVYELWAQLPIEASDERATAALAASAAHGGGVPFDALAALGWGSEGMD